MEIEEGGIVEIRDHRPVGYLLCLQPGPEDLKRWQSGRAMRSSGDTLSGTLDAAAGELPVPDPRCRLTSLKEIA